MVKFYSKSKNGTEYLEDNFRVREFACNDGSDKILIDTTLTSILQMVRNYFGKPVRITSAYRTDSWNKSVGGAGGSQHCGGRAADIVVEGQNPLAVYQYLDKVLGTWGGLILYPNKGFVHVDTRATKYRDVNTSKK